jgi:CubicO group peptidase (beta-lactamase class C family)
MADDIIVTDADVMHGFPPPPAWRVRADQAYASTENTRWYLRHAREVAGTADLCTRGTPVTPLPEALRDLDRVRVARADGARWSMRELLDDCRVDGILVLRGGRVVYERYLHGLDAATPHLCQSITKSVASCVAANLVEAGAFAPGDCVAAIVPELAASAYGDATVRHLLDMTVGIRYEDELDRPEFEGARLCRLEGCQPALAADEPGSMYDFAATTVREGRHGALFHYVSLDTIVLGWVMERATGLPVPELIRSRLWGRLGAEHDAHILLDAAGSAQLEGGLCCSLRDLARLGLMLVQRGRLGDTQVVPAAWIDDVRRNGDKQAFAAAARAWGDGVDHTGSSYRSCFWVYEAADHVAFSAVGWLGQRLYVNQEAGVAVAVFSSASQDEYEEKGTHVFQACEDLASLLA